MIHRIDIFTIPNNRVYETVGEPSGLINATKSLTSYSQVNPILLQYAVNLGTFFVRNSMNRLSCNTLYSLLLFS